MTQRRAVLLLFATLLCRAQTPLGDDWYVVALDSVKSEVTKRCVADPTCYFFNASARTGVMPSI
jgi:hypothetical protein